MQTGQPSRRVHYPLLPPPPPLPAHLQLQSSLQSTAGQGHRIAVAAAAKVPDSLIADSTAAAAIAKPTPIMRSENTSSGAFVVPAATPCLQCAP